MPRGAHAQLTQATLKVVVMDSGGGSIPGASVVATHEQTGSVREGATGEHGDFLLPGLAPGAYVVAVSMNGFQPFRQANVRLLVGSTTDMTVKLAVAGVEEHVEVTGSSARVAANTEARIADSFNRGEIHGLPLPQRDVFCVPKLAAGATLIPGAANSTKLSSSPVVTVNGNRYRGNNYVLDGAMNSNPNNSGEPAIVPALESVDEVQVQTAQLRRGVRAWQRRGHQRADALGHQPVTADARGSFTATPR